MRKIFLCKEMQKFRRFLDSKGIRWQDSSSITAEEHLEKLKSMGIPEEYCDCSIYRTCFFYKDKQFSVINGYSTYGGYDPDTGVNEGLLELYIEGAQAIEGELTAEEVICRVIKVGKG